MQLKSIENTTFMKHKLLIYLLIIIGNQVQLNAKNPNPEISQEINKISKNCKIDLRKSFIDINHQFSNKETFLMFAAKENCFNLAKFLLNNMNADHLLKSTKNMSAYDYSIENNNLELSKILKPTDLTIIGIAKFNDGIGRIPIGIIEHLSNDISINFINTKPEQIIEEQKNEKFLSNDLLSILSSTDNKISKIVLFTDILTTKKYITNLSKYEDRIKFAYSMFESTKIPQKWVEYLNKYFDAVLVPDDFFINTYEESGVNIPIFVLPLGLYLDEFLNKPIKKDKNDIFTFGCLSSFDPRKNHILLIKAFYEEFKNEDNVKLILNGRSHQSLVLKKIIDSLKIKNITMNNENLHWKKYIKTMKSFDCYVNIPKGEGFSVTPREALALGIPCILTNNTAQTTICDSGYVKIVKSNIQQKAVYIHHHGDLGYFFDCKIEDVKKALRDVYENYTKYLDKAHKGREWVKQYCWQNLKTKYLSLFKPTKIILGLENKITDEYLMTDSNKLYNKYIKIINS